MTGTNWNIESDHAGSDFLSTQYSLYSYYWILHSSLPHTISHKYKEGQEELGKSYKNNIKLNSEKDKT